MQSRHEVVRVGVRVAIVIAAVGLLVLLLNGQAYPAEPDALESVLLDRRAPLPGERLAEAETLLRRERHRRLASLALTLSDATLQASSGLSPRSLWSSARSLYREGRSWFRPSHADRRVLDLLEPAIRGGTADAEVAELYQRLRVREESDRARRRLDDAERALGRGELGRARRRLDSARRRAPDSPRLEVLSRLLAEAEELRRIPAPEERFIVTARVGVDEARRTARLLRGDYASLAGSDARTPDERLLRSVSLYLDGRIDLAVVGLRELAEAEGATGDVARRWLDRPGADPDRALHQARLRHRLDRTLQWIGGGRLRSHGTELSRDGLRAWREAVGPLNLAVGLPARLLRGDDAPDDAVRAASARYLVLQPHGPRAHEALEGLGEGALSATLRHRGAIWDDGRLRLPDARTRYPRLLVRPVLLTRGLLDRSVAPELAARAEGASGLLVATSWHGPLTAGEVLPRESAITLLRTLARALDAGDAHPFGPDRGAALETLRRTDQAVRSGETQLWVRPWSNTPEALRSGLASLLSSGGRRTFSQVDVESQRESLLLSRPLIGADLACPPGAVCLDRDREWTSSAYAEVGTSGEVRLGTRAAFGQLAVSLEIEEFLPRASLSIPLAQWMRLQRWLPGSARIGVGVDGISVGAALDDSEIPASPTEPLGAPGL